MVTEGKNFMNKKIILVLIIHIFSSCSSMEQEFKAPENSSTLNSTDWVDLDLNENDTTPFILQNSTDAPQQIPVLIIHHGLPPEEPTLNEEKGQETPEGGLAQQTDVPLHIDNPVQQLILQQSSGSRIPTLITDFYNNMINGITNNQWYQNKPVRYSTFAGTGFVTFGLIGYFYLHNKK